MAGRKVSVAVVVVAGLVIALVLAFFVSQYASSQPDGLEKVVSDKGIDTGVKDSAVADGPLADYAVSGVDDEGLSTGLAGIIGVTVTFVVGVGVFVLVRAARLRRPAPV